MDALTDTNGQRDIRTDGRTEAHLFVRASVRSFVFLDGVWHSLAAACMVWRSLALVTSSIKVKLRRAG